MADTRKSKKHCSICGKSIPSFAPGGHCPHCLLRGTGSSFPSEQWEERFSVVRELGEGGFGRVFLAEQHEPVRRKVALKIIKPGMDTREVVARFEVERQTLAALDHPYIATIYDAGETRDGQPAIAMEYVPGAPLTVFAREHRLSLQSRLQLFLKVCEGVCHAHLHGIIHRDLKPNNILTYYGKDEEVVVRIIDFGIAKATRHEINDATLITVHHRPMGTPAYMSPEQAEARPDVDVRTDVYSLGALLYEILTNSPPLVGLDSDESTWGRLLEQIREEPPVPPSRRLAKKADASGITWEPKTLSGDLDWIVLTALAKDRQRRYQSVDALRKDVQAYLDGRPVQARPPSLSYRASKWVQRHKAISAAAITAVISLVGGTIVSTGLAIQAGRARAQAEQSERRADSARKESNQRFSRSDYQQGCRLLSADDFESGIAHLCRALRTDPENRPAADRLLATLAYSNFLHPALPEAQHPSRLIDVFFRNEEEYCTVSEAGVVGKWDRVDGRRLGDWMHHGNERIVQSALSPDRNLLATVTAQRSVRVWNLSEGITVLHTTMEPPSGSLLAVTFPDNDSVVVGSQSGRICKWEISSQSLQWKMEQQHPVQYLDAAGGLIVVAGARDACLLKSSDGSRLPFRLSHRREIMRARFSPDGTRVLTASLDGSARIWKVANGQAVTPFMSHDLSLYDATWAPGGMRVATAGYDSIARVWWADSGKPVSTGLRHDDHVYATLLPLGGKFLATGGRDQKLRLWDLSTGRLAAPPVSHLRSVSCLDLDLERGQILVGGRHQQARVLDIRRRSAVPKVFEFPGRVVFSQSQDDGRVIRTLYRINGERIIERRDVRTQETLGEPLRLGEVAGLDAAKLNDRLVVRQDNRLVRIYANSAGDLLVPAFTCQSDIKHLEIDAGGRFVFICGADGSAVLLTLDMPDDSNSFGLASVSLNPFGDQPVDDVIMLGDPLYLAARRGDRVVIYSTSENRWLPQGIVHPGGIGSWDFHPGKGLLITGGFHDTAKLWDIHKGVEVCPSLSHADAESDLPVKVQFSPDGRRAVTSSWHELAARVWDTDTGLLVANPLYQNAHIDSLAIDPTSRYLATTSDDRTMRIWNIEDGHEAFPVQHLDGVISRGRFMHGGSGYLAVRGNESLLWPLPACKEAAPEWVPFLAEAMVGHRLDSAGILHRLPDAPMRALKGSVPEVESSFQNWFQWITTDPSARSKTVPMN